MKAFNASAHDIGYHKIDLNTNTTYRAGHFNGKMARPGDSRSRGLRVVCRKCNNGWMSVLQSNAKPSIENLLVGNSIDFTSRAQRNISAWAAMFSMVFEFAHPETSCISVDERRYLMERNVPPPSWLIWVAPFSGISQDGGAWHRGFGRLCIEDNRETVLFQNSPQLSIFAAGKFIVVAVSMGDFADKFFSGCMHGVAKKKNLFRVWPVVDLVNANYDWSVPALNDGDFNVLTDLFSGAIIKILYK